MNLDNLIKRLDALNRQNKDKMASSILKVHGSNPEISRVLRDSYQDAIKGKLDHAKMNGIIKRVGELSGMDKSMMDQFKKFAQQVENIKKTNEPVR